MVLVITGEEPSQNIPPPLLEKFFDMVQFEMAGEPLLQLIPPPNHLALFPQMVQFVIIGEE
jgi:hypothetical protein